MLDRAEVCQSAQKLPRGPIPAAVLKEFRVCFAPCFALRPGSKEQAAVQPAFSRSVAAFSATRIGLVSGISDSFASPSIGTRRPDVVHYITGDPLTVQSVFRITFFGDLKSRRGKSSSDFTDDEKSHVLDMALELCRQQPFRKFVYFHLCDGALIAFFRLEVGRTALVSQRRPPRGRADR